MYDRPPVVALRQSLSAVAAAHPTTITGGRLLELQEHVCAVVDDFKEAGWLPERVIVAVKQIAQDSGLSTSRGVLSAAAPLTESDAVVVAMVGWCIERYYGAPPTSQAQ